MTDQRGTPSGGRRPRAPGTTNLVVTLLVSAVIATVAFSARQVAPPSIAEFAPHALAQPEEALDQVAPPGDVGQATPPTPTPTPTASSAASPSASEPSAAPSPTTIATEAVKSLCVGDPPRQTWDPQSPPCVNFWEGDNGGATYKGVTAEDINVALPLVEFFGPDDAMRDALVQHFNRSYEFYGRKIRLVSFPPTGSTFAHPIPDDMINDARKADEELHAFASLSYVDRKGSEHHYYDELARRGIISVAGLGNLDTTDRLLSFAPYEWTTAPPVDVLLRTWGGYLCDSLYGKPTQHQDPAALGPQERVFGLVVNAAQDGAEPPYHLLVEEADARCGLEFVEVQRDTTLAPSDVDVISKMAGAGVTTVVCVCSPNTLRGSTEGSYMNQASAQGYHPEWVVSTFLGNDADNSYDQAPPDQAQNVFGIAFMNRRLPKQQMPFYRAMKESDPAQNPDGTIYYTLEARYLQLLVLASGIQAAGPNLTPETFAAGLRSLRYANPGAGGPPYWQAAVGFNDGVPAFLNGDAYTWWFSPSDSGTINTNSPGAICPVNDGARYHAGEFPGLPAYFQRPCK